MSLLVFPLLMSIHQSFAVFLNNHTRLRQATLSSSSLANPALSPLSLSMFLSSIYSTKSMPSSSASFTSQLRTSTNIPMSSVPSPAMTLMITDKIFPTSLTSLTPTISPSEVYPSSPSASTSPLTATNSGFWENKGAVGGTFAVVGLVVLGAIVFLMVTFIKRVKKKRRTSKPDGYYSNSDLRREPSRTPSSLDYSLHDPFAADLGQFRGSAVSLPSTRGHTATTHISDDDGASRISSNHHGFSNICYYTGSRLDIYDPSQASPITATPPPKPNSLSTLSIPMTKHGPAAPQPIDHTTTSIPFH